MIRLTKPEIGEEEIEAIAAVLRSGFLVQGAHVQEFERRVAEYVGVKHAIAVSSGTAALHLSLLALGIGSGDEVIVPDFTFPATANVVEITGAKVVLVDIELETFNINPALIQDAITPRTRAIIPVHLFGSPANMDFILRVAKENKLFVIEDAACALGAELNDKKCGTMGNLGCFSFHPRKAVTTGEGGMIVTNDDELAISLAGWRNHGMTSVGNEIRFELAGLNYRMTDFQGALGVAQINRLERILASRREIAEHYYNALKDVPGLQLPTEIPGTRHIWQSYVILLPHDINRNRVIVGMKTLGVETTIGTYANSSQPYYSAMGVILPNSIYAFKQGICLPLHTYLTPSDIEKVVECLKKVL